MEKDKIVPPIKVENIDAEDGNIEILGNSQDYSLTMYLPPDVDNKHFIKFIKAVERSIRSNDDYKMWLENLRDDPHLCRDAFLHNITSNVAEIQLHHYPFNLYSIVRIVTESYFAEKKKVSSFIIADEVIRLHLVNMVGLVPLTVTTHQMAHLGKFVFRRDQIIGGWEKFFNTYTDFLDEYEIDLVTKLIEVKSLNGKDADLLELEHNEKKPRKLKSPDFNLEDEIND